MGTRSARRGRRDPRLTVRHQGETEHVVHYEHEEEGEDDDDDDNDDDDDARSPSPNTREGVSDASDETFSIMSYSSELGSRFSYVSEEDDEVLGTSRQRTRDQNHTHHRQRRRRRQTLEPIYNPDHREETPTRSHTATEVSQQSTSLEDDASSSSVLSPASASSLSSLTSSLPGSGSGRPRLLKRLAVCLWHFLPLIVLGGWSLYALFSGDRVFSQLSRGEVLEWRDDGRVAVLRNRTIVFSNGTLLFYNGSRRFPDGSWTHREDICYEDLAECAADRVAPDARNALKTFLESNVQEEAAAAATAGVVEPYCGFASKTRFRSWSGMIQSEAPILYPRNDSEVVDAIRAIGDAGCKVRPVGGRHSESGISVDSFDLRAVGISLARYTAPPDADWTLQDTPSMRARLGREKRIRGEAGRTFLHLNRVIRPLGYHLPTLPETWSLSLGGAVAGLVPGATFGRSFVGVYATRLRVALADGRIIDIADPLDLAMWRGSMGLNGLILGVEFEVEPRKHYSMGARKTLVHEWNPWFLDAAISSLLPGAQGAHYMLDPWTDELVGIGFVTKRPRQRLYERLTSSSGSTASRFQSDDDCTFDVARLQCNFPEFCEYRFMFGDFLPAHSCRLRRHPDPDREAIREAYDALQPIMDLAADTGLPDAPAEHPSGLRQCHWDMRLESIMQTAHESRALLNDGFWSLSAPRSVSISYLFPVEKLFRALDVLRTLVRELVIRNAPFSMRDAPVTFQFVRLEERTQVLLPHNAPVGDFVSIQVRVTPGKGDTAHAWRYALAELEQRWQLAFPDVAVFPNPGQVFGLHVFRAANATREEALMARYRRIRRVRDAFQLIKHHYEARMREDVRRRAPHSQQSTSWFGGGSSQGVENMRTFEEVYGVVDPSLAMLREIQAEIAETDISESEFLARRQEHEAARLAVDREDEYFGDINRELIQEAYAGDGASDASLLGSLPVPFMDPMLQRKMFSQAQMAAFLRYRQTVDPENRFWGGKATQLFSQKLKRSISGLDDPDTLAEAHLILDLKHSELRAEIAREARKNMIGSTILVAMLFFGAYRIGQYLWQRRSRRRRRGRRDSSSDDDTASDASGSDSSNSSSESDSNSESGNTSSSS
ncbi:D-arabinono-1,4-lactone oxidase [Hondaea fermentalgiana]|uniref:D-arabinono-1,4-lactone oxidase n=1 Tax=Hondaea fermentalgiana TaxID=2315210 RepID=A0A2R5G7N8_9STRA|nr:D-arabinono-1,4-lactone oxidase [Hondaea fermentalgiana]|eukprot:GBG26339.1 D-arabinono-1,4-lactone oxidase [Hondaea fermentalgiana]